MAPPHAKVRMNRPSQQAPMPSQPQQKPATPARPMVPHTLQHSGEVVKKGLMAVVVLIVIYLIATWLINAFSVVYINGPTPVTLTKATTIFYMAGSEYTANLISVSASSATAMISLARIPAFMNPSYRISLYLGNNTNVNATGQYSNMEIRLTTITNNSAGVVIIPVSQTFQLPPSTGRISVVQTSLYDIRTGSGQVNPLPATTTVGSTTTSASTTSSSTTSGSTTTISTNLQIATDLVHNSIYYPVMLNLTPLYDNSTNCTASAYSAAYQSKWGHSPTGVNSYQNQSGIVPYQMTFSLTNTSSSVYVGTYTTASRNASFPEQGPGLIITTNITQNLITSTKLQNWFFSLPVSSMKSTVNTAKLIGGACGIIVAYCASPC